MEDMEASEILKINEGRCEIEESLRILKSTFKSRSIYHRKNTRITAHFAICFTSLLIYRLLEKKSDSKYNTDEIINQLR
ncbi:hypothetical protein [Haploplasma axanthum]|uniref:hypothetical protein n=1 Tax=Haploplasma axanthum TaxID=29552 RepID=UPI002FC3D217